MLLICCKKSIVSIRVSSLRFFVIIFPLKMANIDDDDDSPKSLFIFGTDVGKIPCFRESFINGIIGGIVTGVGTFVRTSKPRVSCNFGMGAYLSITFFYYQLCRYNYSRDKMLTAQIQEGMRLNALYQGTDLERQIRDEFLEETKDP